MIGWRLHDELDGRIGWVRWILDGGNLKIAGTFEFNGCYVVDIECMVDIRLIVERENIIVKLLTFS